MRRIVFTIISLGICLNVLAGVRTVREDRTWEYCVLNASTGDESINKVCFEGTVQYDGKTYHKFKLKEATSWLIDHFNKVDIKLPVTEKYDKVLAMMREENGRIYYLSKYDEYNGIIVMTDEKDLNGCNETLLCDFNMKAGDKFESGGIASDCDHSRDFILKGGGSTGRMEIVCKANTTTQISGEQCRSVVLKHADTEEFREGEAFIEGIGFTKSFMIRPVYLITSCIGSYYENFQCVYNEKGEAIYGRPAHVPTGYGDVSAITESDEMIVFNGKILRAVSDGNVCVGIFNTEGSKVAGAEGAGEVSVSTSGLIPGVYVVRAAGADGRNSTRKIVVK